jgi:LytS/YehU family sensor histidine kinase
MGIVARPAEGTLLDILIEAMPFLRNGLSASSARATVDLLCDRLAVDAAAIVSNDTILAYAGAGADHHTEGLASLTEFTRRALEGTVTRVTHAREEIGCAHADCPLSAAAIAPLHAGTRVVGAIKLYRAYGGVLSDPEIRIISGLGRLFSVYLELGESDARLALQREAELGALRAQISPHFLFNTLTSIAALTRSDAARAHDLIVDFADFFRHTLSKHGEFVMLREELDQVERYVHLERARFGDRLHVRYEIDPALLETTLPILSIQPLVENAVMHGVAPMNGPGTVRVRVNRSRHAMEVAVIDDGVGIAPERIARVLEPGVGDGLGIGLSNVDRRLEMSYGTASRLRIESQLERGTTVRFRVPCTRK